MDPHDELGVARGASIEEIRRAFAAAVRSVHPDGGGRADAERLRRLIEARDQLLGRPGSPSAPVDGERASTAPAGGYRNLTRLQVAARVLGRLLYVSRRPDS
jgi:curved DNA-binding protein CbpA